MVYLPPPPPAGGAPYPIAVIPAPYQTRPIQPRLAPQTLPNPYTSISINNAAYPAYLYSARAIEMSRQAGGGTYPGYLYPTPNYYAYNINVNLPFAGALS